MKVLAATYDTCDPTYTQCASPANGQHRASFRSCLTPSVSGCMVAIHETPDPHETSSIHGSIMNQPGHQSGPKRVVVRCDTRTVVPVACGAMLPVLPAARAPCTDTPAARSQPPSYTSMEGCGPYLGASSLCRSADSAHLTSSNVQPASSLSTIFLRVLGRRFSWNSTRDT